MRSIQSVHKSLYKTALPSIHHDEDSEQPAAIIYNFML